MDKFKGYCIFDKCSAKHLRECKKLYGDLVAVSVNGTGNMRSETHSGFFYDEVLLPSARRVRVLEDALRTEPCLAVEDSATCHTGDYDTYAKSGGHKDIRKAKGIEHNVHRSIVVRRGTLLNSIGAVRGLS